MMAVVVVRKCLVKGVRELCFFVLVAKPQIPFNGFCVVLRSPIYG